MSEHLSVFMAKLQNIRVSDHLSWDLIEQQKKLCGRVFVFWSCKRLNLREPGQPLLSAHSNHVVSSSLHLL